MVETKDNGYWNTLSKEGEIESKIISHLERLFNSYLELSSDSIFQNDSHEFLNSFQDEINNALNCNIY